MTGIRFAHRIAQKKEGVFAVFLSLGVLAGSAGWAQSVPPAPTIQEAPSLQNETLQGVNYNNRYEISGAPAFSHFNSGPALVQGTNLGGFVVEGTRWSNSWLGVTASLRGYYGTQGVVPNDKGIRGPFVFEHQGLGGISTRALKNEHYALTFHALGGFAYGVFDTALNPGVTPPELGLFNNGFAPAMVLGGSLDLNRSSKLALRLTPDYLLTYFGGGPQNEFGISVGILYRFSKRLK